MISYVIRPAGSHDRTLLWCWRNDPVTREMERIPGIIPPDVYAVWLENMLSNNNYRVMIAETGSDAIAVGFVYACLAGTAEIGICLNPAYRGLGLSRGLLDAFTASARDEMDFIHISAAVKMINTPSRRLFARAGYSVDAVRNDIVYFSRMMKTKKDPACQACGVQEAGK